MLDDLTVIRPLAEEYAQAAAHPRNTENAELYRAVNGLRMRRPVVLIDEIPFWEFGDSQELLLRCTDEDFRCVEGYMRRKLYQWRHFPADMIVPPFIPVEKIIGGDPGWLGVQEDTLAYEKDSGIISHHYIDQLAEARHIEKLKMPALTYEKVATEHIRDKLNEAVGDIVPARIVGHNVYISPWDLMATFRGVDNLLIDLVDRPEHIHAIMERMTAVYAEQYIQYERLGLLEAEPLLVHCTAGLCDELNTEGNGTVLRKNVWGRGMAQILATVSPAMHDEYEINYQKRLMAPFGLVYYGCCEPLDRKIDIVEKIPHLRKISITPWADARVAAQAIGKKYVLSLKPNPANVGSGFDRDAIAAEVKALLDVCYQNGCSCELVLKDISTVCHKPSNLELWEKTVMEIVRSY